MDLASQLIVAHPQSTYLAPTKPTLCQVLVADSCSPSYSAGRDQEDHSSKPAQANSLQDPISEETHHKRELVEWLKV
jgi:hypothetical protein